MKNEYFSMRRLLTAGAIMLSGLVLTGCDKDDDDNPPDTPVAGLMAANLAVDKPSIGIALSGNPLSNVPIGYINYTGGYLPIFTGQRNVQAYDFSTGTGFTSGSFNFEDGKYYSLFVIGANDNYANVLVNDNFDPLDAGNGMAYVRYVNASPDSSESTITVSVDGNNAVSETTSYADVSEFVEVSPGSVTIDVGNGSAIDANRTVTFEAGKVYTILLVGDPASLTSGVEIRYIENGELSDDDMTSAAATVGVTP